MRAPVTALRVNTKAPSKSRPQAPKTPPSTRSPGSTNPKEALCIDLSRYTRMNDRAQVIGCLQKSSYLRNIPLDPGPNAPTTEQQWQELEEEVSQGNLILNGLAFCGQDARSAFDQRRVLKVMQELCVKLTTGIPELSGFPLYQALIVRLAQTTSSADAYFQLNAVMGSRDLILQPRNTPQKHKQKGRRGNMVESPTHVTDTPPCPPSELMLYQAGNQVHACLTVSHLFGLYRKTDVATGIPWIHLLAAVHERVNLSTGDSVRYITGRVIGEK